MDLVLIRHPAVDIDTGICYGQSDIGLRDDPSISADAIAARLAMLPLSSSPHRILSSPLSRCASVAAALAGRFACEAPHCDARLMEIDFGAWERREWSAIDRRELDEWAADLLHARAHGGESVGQFTRRVSGWFDDVSSSADPAVHVVTHAGVIRVVTAIALGVPIERCLQWALDMPSVVWLRRGAGDGGSWALVKWNA